jgi:hypothetical protein
MSQRNWWLALAILGCAALGCSDSSLGRFAVSGKAKLKDQPLANGIVMFEPLDGQDTAGNAMLTNGEYAIPREAGLKAGRYRVRVTAGDGKTADNPVDPDAPPGPGGGTNIISKELVPASWNTQSKQEVTVKPEGPNTFDFDIK